MTTMILPKKGTQIVTREEMIGYSLPKATPTYTVISNEEMIMTALESFDKQGFTLKAEIHKSARFNNVFTSKYVFTHGNTEMGMMFANINSYDGTKKAAYAIGANVFVCDNGMINGEEVGFRKHTGKANPFIQNAITEGVKKIGDNFRLLEEDVKQMKGMSASKKVAAALIGDMYLNEGIIRSNQLGIIKGEMEVCTFDYKIEDSLYNVYQNCTYAFKHSHPTEYLKQHTELHKYLINELT